MRERLVRLLRAAHAGELAAAIAYRGHAAAVADPTERAEILRIMDQELDHRERAGRMLAVLGAVPDPHRERRARIVGTALAVFCRFGGWFLPMYGAARLESRNVREYESAAACAPEFAAELMAMADVERDHERYFRGKAESHWLGRFFPKLEYAAPRIS